MNERANTRMTAQTDDLSFYTGFWDLSNGSTKTTLEGTRQKHPLVGLFGDATFGSYLFYHVFASLFLIPY